MKKPSVKNEDIVSGAVVEQVIAAVNALTNTVEGKATQDEIQAYKSFVCHVAETVVKAAACSVLAIQKSAKKK